jgi:hypothetical protein
LQKKYAFLPLSKLPQDEAKRVRNLLVHVTARKNAGN